MGTVLYSFRRCPYAMRARMALSIAGTDYEHREILLRNKPQAMLEASPKGSVPVLLVDNKVIDESLDIMRWALPEAKFDADIIGMIDGPFKYHLDRYKYASRYDPNVKRGDIDLSHRRLAVECLQLIESSLGENPYLCGESMGVTDLASFPFVRQFAAVEPEWWAAGADLPKSRDWLSRCVSSALFQTIMEKFPLWQPEN
ncbi:MAG: glutathione S-transferase N-terminal domain-containing protein [Litorimonas sp.]